MNVLITGGAGFIGSHLADRLLAEGHAVRALDNLDPQVYPDGRRPGYLDPEVELVNADVRDRKAVRGALDGIDTVVHFAAAVGVGQSMYEIERYTSINVIGAAVLLEEVVERRDSIHKLVVASSMSIYGEGQCRNPRTGKSGVAPLMRSEEQLAARRWEVLADDGTELEPEPTAEAKPLRPASIYAINKRDHTAADGRAVNVGTGRPTSVLDLAHVIAAGLSKDIEPEIVNQYRAGDIRHCYADPRLAEELLGFRAEIDFESGMRDLLAWLETQEASDSVDVAREALAARGLAR